MSITNELREYVGNFYLFRYKDVREKLDAIADRIDAEHEAQLNDAFETRNSDENQENDGWVRGPLDADGIMWHEGDMSDSVWGEIELIVRDFDGYWYVKGHDTSAPWVRADSMRHHHEPTVEDVLDEFALEIDPSADIAVTGAETIKKFAAKLQLKEHSE